MKRSAPSEMTVVSKKSKTRAAGTSTPSTPLTGPPKSCILCCESHTIFPAVSVNCAGRHSNDVCKLCWTRYINTRFMADPSGNTPCVQCSCQVSYDDVKRIISRKDIVHYDFLVHRARAEKESLRECLADILSPTKEQTTCHHFQRHDAQTDGRVFKCSQCGNRECTRCAIPEHVNETCDAFQHRMGFEHGGEEHATAEAFSSGYTGLEGSKEVWKRPKPCPCCGVKIEREDKCQHMTCLKCGNQFCIQCNAAFYGERSVPELGNAAHEKDCVYFKHAKEDRRFKRKDRT